MAFPIAWILNELGQKMYAWASTKSVMDFDRGGENGQTLQKTLQNLENKINSFIAVPKEFQFPVSEGITIDTDGATYFKTSDGVVTINFALRGTFTAYPNSVILGVMPEGFRPSHSIVTAICQQGENQMLWCKVLINTTGQVIYFGSGETTLISGTISYLAV